MSKTVTLEVSDTSSIEIDFYFLSERGVWSCDLTKIVRLPGLVSKQYDDSCRWTLSLDETKRLIDNVADRIFDFVIDCQCETDPIRLSVKAIHDFISATFELIRIERKFEVLRLHRHNS
jgi:hypothetical protein